MPKHWEHSPEEDRPESGGNPDQSERDSAGDHEYSDQRHTDHRHSDQRQHGSGHAAHDRRHRRPGPPPPPRRRWPWFFAALTGWAVAAVLGGLLWWAWQDQADYYDTSGGVYETYFSGARRADQRIAILDVSGVIVDGYAIHDQIKRIQADDRIVAIVLRIETPGGTVTGSDYIFHYLDRLRQETELPMVVSMGSMATSGGYYVAMSVGDQEDVIFAEPTTITGSIGVVLPHYDISGFLQRFDIEDDSIRSHPNKQMLSMTRRMSTDQRAIIQREVDTSFERFKRVVLHGRPSLRRGQNISRDPNSASMGSSVELLAPDGEQDLATGQVFSASEAIQLGLIDRIGFLEDAIDRAAELAGVSTDEVRVVRFARPKPLIELPALIQDNSNSHFMSLLTRPVSHQCWYLAGDAPPLLPMRFEFERE